VVCNNSDQIGACFKSSSLKFICMEELHSLSIQLFELVRQYEEVIKDDKDFSEVEELKHKILEAESKLRFYKQKSANN